MSVLYYIANVVAFLMLPNNCTTGETGELSLVEPSTAALLFSSVLFGLYDAIASIIGEALICKSST